MKNKSKNKRKKSLVTEREAQLGSQVLVMSELLDITRTIIEDLIADNDSLAEENNNFSELVRSLHRKIKKLQRKIGRQQETIAVLDRQLQKSNSYLDFWYHKAQEYKEKIDGETDDNNDDEILDIIE